MHEMPYMQATAACLYVKSIISSHNKSVLKDQSVTSASQVDKDCNCRKKDTCPLSGKYLTTNVVYQATVTRDDTNEQETDVGHTECQFKTRHNGYNAFPPLCCFYNVQNNAQKCPEKKSTCPEKKIMISPLWFHWPLPMAIKQ